LLNPRLDAEVGLSLSGGECCAALEALVHVPVVSRMILVALMPTSDNLLLSVDLQDSLKKPKTKKRSVSAWY
jgi:hypothetical protein